MKWMFKTPRGISVSESLRIAKAAGYDGIEIQLYDVLETIDREEVTEAVRASGLSATLHCPSGDLNLSSGNLGIRRESLRQILAAVRFAKKIKALSVTVHPGRLSSKRDDAQAQRLLMREAWKRIAEAAEEEQVLVGIENMENRPKEIYTTLASINGLLAAAPSDYAGITLDFAHLYTVSGSTDIRELQVPIANVHISQCVHGKPHCSLFSGEGQLDVRSCIAQLSERGYDGTVVVEEKGLVTAQSAKRNIDFLKMI